MIYNKTKRGLEKASGIVGLVVSIIETITMFILFIIGIMGSAAYFNYNIYSGGRSIYVDLTEEYTIIMIIAIIFLILSILTIIFSSMVISSPVCKNGTFKNRTAKRVCVVVFTVLSGNLVSAGLMIAVLCMKDFVEDYGQVETETQTVVFSQNNQNVASEVGVVASQKVSENQLINEFAKNLLEIKHLHDIGVIEETNYKKAVQKIVDNFLDK